MIFSLIAGLILGAGALLFVIQNTGVVTLTFLGWQFEGSLALLVLVSLGIGIVISMLAIIPSTISASLQIARLEKHNKKLAQELEERQQMLTAANQPTHTPAHDPGRPS